VNNKHRTLLIILLSFGIYYAVSKLFSADVYNWLKSYITVIPLAYFLTYLAVSIPLIISLFLINRPERILLDLGVNKGFAKGLLLSFCFTLPMLIGYSIFFRFNNELTLNGLLINVLFAALFEEIIYRGILFGQIFRHTILGFIPATLLSALVFAAGHLWQSTDVSTLAGIFLITFAGAVFFAWTYIEWDKNLWIPIGLHFFMNLHWMLFSAGDNALGNVYANVFRAITIALTIIITLMYKKRKKLNVTVNKSTLWLKSPYAQMQDSVK